MHIHYELLKLTTLLTQEYSCLSLAVLYRETQHEPKFPSMVVVIIANWHGFYVTGSFNLYQYTMLVSNTHPLLINALQCFLSLTNMFFPIATFSICTCK